MAFHAKHHGILQRVAARVKVVQGQGFRFTAPLATVMSALHCHAAYSFGELFWPHCSVCSFTRMAAHDMHSPALSIAELHDLFVRQKLTRFEFSRIDDSFDSVGSGGNIAPVV